MDFQKGDKAISEEQVILLIQIFKGKLWGISNKPKGPMYTFNTATIVNITNDSRGIKMKLLGNVQKLQLKEKTVCKQVFKRAYKQYHRQHQSIITKNIIETCKLANSIQNWKFWCLL